jgi:hypothetical protein
MLASQGGLYPVEFENGFVCSKEQMCTSGYESEHWVFLYSPRQTLKINKASGVRYEHAFLDEN